MAAGALANQDVRWWRPEVGSADWWFAHAPIEEVAGLLATSYIRRHRAARSVPGLHLVDRGIAQLEAVIAATVSVREGLEEADARTRAAELLSTWSSDLEEAEHNEFAILLLHGSDPAADAEVSLSREAMASSRYVGYERALNRILHQQAAESRYDRVVHVNQRPIVPVQNEIRQAIGEDLDLRPALADVHIVAIGGMSESGKSTAAAHLANKHGYARLKIGWLIDTAAGRHRVVEPYKVDSDQLAELCIDALERYCQAHYFVRRVTIESLHRDGFAHSLRKLLGAGLTIVYLECPEPTRRGRGLAGPIDVADRDRVKRLRGAERVRDVADLVVDNGGSSQLLFGQLDRFHAEREWQRCSPRAVVIDGLRIPKHLKQYLDELITTLPKPDLSMVAITGSGAQGAFRPGWSDLDILLVTRDGLATGAGIGDIRKALESVSRHKGGVKVGVTVISEAELSAGALHDRALHALGMTADGREAILWRREGFVLPRPPDAVDNAASVDALPMVVFQIRRHLLAGVPDFRALYKCAAMFAKIVLRARQGDDRPNDGDALRAFCTGHLDRVDVRLADAAAQDRGTLTEVAAELVDWWVGSFQAGRGSHDHLREGLAAVHAAPDLPS